MACFLTEYPDTPIQKAAHIGANLLVGALGGIWLTQTKNPVITGIALSAIAGCSCLYSALAQDYGITAGTLLAIGLGLSGRSIRNLRLSASHLITIPQGAIGAFFLLLGSKVEHRIAFQTDQVRQCHEDDIQDMMDRWYHFRHQAPDGTPI